MGYGIRRLVELTVGIAAIDATYRFFESMGMPMHLRDVGIDESRLGEMARHVAENDSLEQAWAPLTEADIKQILDDSL